MADTPSLRRLVLDRVVAALESIDAKIPVVVNIEPDGTLVVRAPLGDIAPAAATRPPTPSTKAVSGGVAKRRGRPPKAAAPATSEPAAAPQKRRGRKPGRSAKSAKAAPAKSNESKAAFPSIRAKSTPPSVIRDAILQALRDHKPGYTHLGLAKLLGVKADKKKLTPALNALKKESGPDQVEEKTGHWRLKNVERTRGPRKKAAPAKSRGSGKAKPGSRKTGPAARAAKKAPAEKSARKKPAAKKAKSKNTPVKATKAKPIAKKSTKAKSSEGKKTAGSKKTASKATKEASDRTDEGGQIPRDETRKSVETPESAES